jgi:hypothetical protein
MEALTVRLRLGEFGWSLVDHAAAARGETPGAFVEAACHDFHRRLLAPTPNLEAPSLRTAGGAHERQLTLSAEPEVWEDLRLEAGRQGIDLARLIEHAVMLTAASEPPSS